MPLQDRLGNPINYKTECLYGLESRRQGVSPYIEFIVPGI